MNTYKFFKKENKDDKPGQRCIDAGLTQRHKFFFAKDSGYGAGKEFCSEISLSLFLRNYREAIMYNIRSDFREEIKVPVFHLYETIIGGSSHYEYYDFDEEDPAIIAKETSQQFFERFVRDVRDKMKEPGEVYKWKILESSTPKKRSLHVVNRNKKFKEGSMIVFVEEMARKVYPNDNNPLSLLRNSHSFDRKVYSKNRQMRMIGSSKYGKKNIFKVAMWHMPSHRSWDSGFWDEFFITNVEDEKNVVYLETKKVESIDEYIPADDEEKKIQRILNKYAGDTFTVSQRENWSNGRNGYSLKRKKEISRWCDICDRDHAKQHQFATIYNGCIYLHCRSGEKGNNSLFLGSFITKIAKKGKGKKRAKKVLDRYFDTFEIVY